MKEVRGDLWVVPAEWRIIPTNGTIKRSGDAVMGAGVAEQAATRYPMLPKELGRFLKRSGNHVFAFPHYGLLTFPTKDKWFEDSTLALIEQSVEELKGYLYESLRYAMPRVGTGHGRLTWEQVKPIVARLPDNVRVVHSVADALKVVEG